VNDPPSFNQIVDEDAGLQRIPLSGWAQDILPGPENERGQTVRFRLVSVDRPGLFPDQPAISPGGALSVTPYRNKSGKTAVTAILKDDGGRERGGADQSASVRFSIRTLRVSRTGADASADSPPAAP
jgi:large repetitive protein